MHTFITYENEEYNLTTDQACWRTTVVQKLGMNLKTITLNFPIAAKYIFSKGYIGPYAGTGVDNIFVLSQNQDFIYHHFYDEFNQSIPTYHLGLILKAGSNFKFRNHHSIFTELNYEYTQSLNINRSLKLTDNLFSFMAGYDF